MGRGLFPAFPAETRLASDILGYDIEELCAQDPRRQLVQTQFTQPALYVVNAFHYQKQYAGAPPGFLAGHSLGEYNALLAAGAFDFETGLRLVQKRGELMAAASGGGMAAVIGLSAGELQSLLREGGYDDIDLANFNAPGQIVIAGKKESIEKVVEGFKAKDITIMPLANGDTTLYPVIGQQHPHGGPFGIRDDAVAVCLDDLVEISDDHGVTPPQFSRGWPARRAPRPAGCRTLCSGSLVEW